MARNTKIKLAALAATVVATLGIVAAVAGPRLCATAARRRLVRPRQSTVLLTCAGQVHLATPSVTLIVSRPSEGIRTDL